VTKDHDLIYRQAALEVLETSADLIRRALDCTDLVGAERDKFEWGLGLIEPLIYDMKSLPTVDAVPVVRCRDCKRYQNEVGDDEYAIGWCPFITINLVSRNEFCAWGKRKEGGNAAD
jgi:hypothetical protein